jgi:hypothetical protein
MSRTPVTRHSATARRVAKPKPRARISARFTLSWDGRVLDCAADAPAPAEFRQLVADGLVDELTITWQARIIGGKKLEPVTGLDPAFLPAGVELDLLSLAHRSSGILARYRVRQRR